MDAFRFSRCLSLLILAVVLAAISCSPEASQNTNATSVQHIRVRLLQDVDHIEVMASDYPAYSYESDPKEHVLGFPRNTPISISLSGANWKVGTAVLPPGVMILRPGSDGSAKVDGHAYHGVYKLVATSAGKFDVINDVDIDGYLKGVIAREMLAGWELQAYEAQAVAARTYAMYEARTGGLKRYWDVYADTRSQVYGGIDGETQISREAVDATTGIVLVYGPGEGTIFKAYFSSCCGGVSQAVSDAFPGDPYILPLSEQNHGSECNQSKWFNWGPIILPESEVLRRMRQWGLKHGRPEANLPSIARIDIAQTNRYLRPTRFVLTDGSGMQYSLPCEDLRTAVNTDANGGLFLPSSFCKVAVDTKAHTVTFFDGHGFGHGVGLCQYCAQAKALQGEHHEQILAEAYPGSRRVRAY